LITSSCHMGGTIVSSSRSRSSTASDAASDLVLEDPRDCHRGVDDDGHQRRPSSIIFGPVVRPRRTPRRASHTLTVAL
jgi:hypothetical protein